MNVKKKKKPQTPILFNYVSHSESLCAAFSVAFIFSV